MSRWFRFYSDAVRNPKVARLNDQQFRLWVELLTVAAENDGLIPPLGDLKHVLKRRLDHLSRGLDDLIRAELMDPLEHGYEPHNWRKFQYKSDTSTERVKKLREKRNVSETPPETEADTETEADIEPKGSLPPKARAKRATALPDDWQPEMVGEIREIVRGWTKEEFKDQLANFKDHAKANGRTQKDWPAAFRTWARKHNGWREKNGNRGNTQQRNHSAPPQHNPLVRAVIAEREARAAGDGYGQPGGGAEDSAGAW